MYVSRGTLERNMKETQRTLTWRSRQRRGDQTTRVTKYCIIIQINSKLTSSLVIEGTSAQLNVLGYSYLL